MDYSTCLQKFANHRSLKGYLDPDSRNILLQKARSLKEQLRGGGWKFVIPRENPLTFIKNDSNLQINIACEIKGNGSNIEKHNMELQVWSIRADYYREKKIFEFRIDQKNSTAKEPWHHLHIGELDEPRFPFPPMDIILLCEFILVNYFPKRSKDLREDLAWKHLVVCSQNMFQKEYFNVCRNCIENKTDTTLMEHLLNLP